ncbi:MAG: type VI secretion system-associated protein TagF, partial [Candidatus Zixiibacteriota bacterium]
MPGLFWTDTSPSLSVRRQSAPETEFAGWNSQLLDCRPPADVCAVRRPLLHDMLGNVAPPVGLFGKVPSHPDFVRLNAGSPLARSLDSWMQEGLSQMRVQLGEGWEAAFDRSQPLYFVYRDKDPSEVLVGVCRPGRDQSGRRYPFSIFAQMKLGRGGAGLHLLPYACGRFLKAARRLATV